jgi:hypothetical protein
MVNISLFKLNLNDYVGKKRHNQYETIKSGVGSPESGARVGSRESGAGVGSRESGVRGGSWESGVVSSLTQSNKKIKKYAKKVQK